MIEGSLVRWKGFDWQNASKQENIIGLVVKIWCSPYNEKDIRINVIWGPGNYGKGLYPETVEVIE